MKPHLLIIDDDENICTQLKWGLAEDYTVSLAEDRPSAMKIVHELKPSVVLLDLGLPPSPSTPTEGFAALAEILEADCHAKVVVATGQSELENARDAIGAGAYDLQSKPVDMDELKLILRRAYYVSCLEREHARMLSDESSKPFEGMLGASPPMLALFSSIRKVSTTDASVLILGASGTGKELAARAIHRCSNRSGGPFVAINCGAIPEALLESELFGHEKGAFTGAHGQRKGHVELAAGGTLFLDEVGELPQSLQVKLLRFLQDRRITRLGGGKEIAVDARVIAATNADLKQLIGTESFREDLYYRLAVVVLQMPALCERAGDVTYLARAFLNRFESESRRRSLKFSAAALSAIEKYDWPGNVRELENRVRRAVIMTEGRRISVDDLELGVSQEPPVSLREARDRLDRQLVEQAMRQNAGKISGAAKDLGISRPTLYELMQKLGISKQQEPAES